MVLFCLLPMHVDCCCTCTPIQVAGWWSRRAVTTCGGHLFPAPGMAPRRRRARRGGLPKNSGERASELDDAPLRLGLRMCSAMGTVVFLSAGDLSFLLGLSQNISPRHITRLTHARSIKCRRKIYQMNFVSLISL
jgi:hypothetical protein